MTEVAAFADSGFVVVDNGDWRLVISRRLGGAVAVQFRSAAPCYDLGYEAVLAGGRRVATSHWSGATAAPVDGNAVGMTGIAFERAADSLPLVKWMVPFQALVSLLSSGWVAESFQRAIKLRMIRPSKTVGLRLNRSVRWDEESVTIEDELGADPTCPRLQRISPAVHVPFYSPSGRQDREGMLPADDWDPADAARRINDRVSARRVRRFAVTSAGVVLEGRAA